MAKKDASEEEINNAYNKCDKSILEILEESKNNITKYHENKKRQAIFIKRN